MATKNYLNSKSTPVFNPKSLITAKTIKRCNRKRCLTCNDNMKPVFTSSITNKKYVVINHSSKPLCCHSDNIIYLITCTKCGVQYVGETKNKLHIRMNSHRVSLRAKAHTLLYEHFIQTNTSWQTC